VHIFGRDHFVVAFALTQVPGDSANGVNLYLEHGYTYARPYETNVDLVQLQLGRSAEEGHSATAVVKSAAFFHFQVHDTLYASFHSSI